MDSNYVYLLEYNGELIAINKDKITSIIKTHLSELTEVEGHEDIICTKVCLSQSEQERVDREAIYTDLSVKEILSLINGVRII